MLMKRPHRLYLAYVVKKAENSSTTTRASRTRISVKTKRKKCRTSLPLSWNNNNDMLLRLCQSEQCCNITVFVTAKWVITSLGPPSLLTTPFSKGMYVITDQTSCNPMTIKHYILPSSIFTTDRQLLPFTLLHNAAKNRIQLGILIFHTWWLCVCLLWTELCNTVLHLMYLECKGTVW